MSVKCWLLVVIYYESYLINIQKSNVKKIMPCTVLERCRLKLHFHQRLQHSCLPYWKQPLVKLNSSISYCSPCTPFQSLNNLLKILAPRKEKRYGLHLKQNWPFTYDVGHIKKRRGELVLLAASRLQNFSDRIFFSIARRKRVSASFFVPKNYT